MTKRSELAFSRVKAYSQSRFQRTGSISNRKVLAWLEQELQECAAEVSSLEFEYPYFVSTTRVFVDGAEIPSMALYYSAIGDHDIRNPRVSIVNAHAEQFEIDRHILDECRRAKDSGYDGLLLVTCNASNAICAINRHDHNLLNFPVVLIGEYSGQLTDQNKEITFTASLNREVTTNVVASFGDGHNAPVVITTPISGWFECAGERGTGIAVAIELAQKLGESMRVDLLLANGHELGYIGGYELAQQYPEKPRYILHLGSCIANRQGNLCVVSSLSNEKNAEIKEVLRGVSVNQLQSEESPITSNWMGESECWASHAVPMVSIAGISPVFHTKLDNVDVVTNPDLLEDAIAQLEKVLAIMTD